MVFRCSPPERENNAGFSNPKLQYKITKWHIEGFVNKGLQTHLLSYSEKISKRAEMLNQDEKHICENLALATRKYAEVVIANMKTLMSRFGKSCELKMYQNPQNSSNVRFVIESSE